MLVGLAIRTVSIYWEFCVVISEVERVIVTFSLQVISDVALMKFTAGKQPKLYLYLLNEKRLRSFIRFGSWRKPNRFFPSCSFPRSRRRNISSSSRHEMLPQREGAVITRQDAALLILFMNFPGFGRETSIKIYTQKFITLDHSLAVALITYKSHRIHFCQIIACHCWWKSDNRWSIWPSILSASPDYVLASLTFFGLCEIFFSTVRSEINTIIV